jgi:hypothetical protein
MTRKVNPRSLKNLQPYQKGRSGNPGGRPRRVITEAYQERLNEIAERDPQKRTYAQLVAEAQIKQALKGNTMAAKEIADRTEGKAHQALDVEVALDTPLEFNVQVNFLDPDGTEHPTSWDELGGGVPSR